MTSTNRTPNSNHARAGLSLRLARVAWLLSALFASTAPALLTRPVDREAGSLVGQCLVASRQLTEPTFAQTVIYVIAHSKAGAMGVVVNRPLGSGRLKDLVEGFGIKSSSTRRLNLFFGGPVELNRGLVLHSPDYKGEVTRKVSNDFSLSMTTEVLRALADGRGPKRLLILMGYAGWASGQLEAELARRDWLIAAADPDLIFSADPESTWSEALKRVRVSL